MSSRFARLCASVVIVLAFGALAVPAWSQTSASVSLDPTSGAPDSVFTITMKNYKACPSDAACITIDFIQGSTTTPLGTANPNGADSFSGQLHVPPHAAAGAAQVRAHSTTGDDASAGFTVTGAPATTTTTKATTTTTKATSTTSSSSTTSTTAPATTTSESSSTTSSTIVTPTKTKKTSSHSDVPRYIAVALVVLAAAATAGVDTRLRRQGL